MRFSEKADRYEERAFIQADLAAWAAEWLDRLGNLPGPILEVGAGTGLLTKHLVGHLPEVVATDVSEAMVTLGRERVPQVGWQVCDAWAPPAGDWGGLISSSLLQWCPDVAGVFEEWSTMLRPGSRMLHAFFLEGTLSELQEVSPESLAVEFRSAQDWRDSFETAGFEVLDAEVRPVSYGFPAALDLFRFLHGIGATMGPRKLKPSSLRRIIEACDRKRTQSPRGEVESQWIFGRFLCERGD